VSVEYTLVNAVMRDEFVLATGQTSDVVKGQLAAALSDLPERRNFPGWACATESKSPNPEKRPKRVQHE
jgi:hypothetical protein